MLLPYGEWRPTVENPVFVAPGSFVIGQVVIKQQASIWFNAVIRGDLDLIEIGTRTNIQDNVVIHTDAGIPCRVGSNVTVGHGAIIHGATIADRVLIGMGSIIMNRASVGSQCIIGAGTLIPEGKVIPPGHLVVGSPARIIRPLTQEEMEKIEVAASSYVDRWIHQGWQFR